MEGRGAVGTGRRRGDVGTLIGTDAVELVFAAVLSSRREGRERETASGGVCGLCEDLAN